MRFIIDAGGGILGRVGVAGEALGVRVGFVVVLEIFGAGRHRGL